MKVPKSPSVANGRRRKQKVKMTNKSIVKIVRRLSSDKQLEKSREKIQVKQEVSKPKLSSAPDKSRSRSRKKETAKKVKKVHVCSSSRSSSSSRCLRGKTPERKTRVRTRSKLNNAVEAWARKNYRKKVKTEIQPFSNYSASYSRFNINTWKPTLHREHLRYQRKYKLKPISVVCVDMQDVPLMFHNPREPNTHKKSVAVTPHVIVSSARMERLNRLERNKVSAFKKKLNRVACSTFIRSDNKSKSLKGNKKSGEKAKEKKNVIPVERRMQKQLKKKGLEKKKTDPSAIFKKNLAAIDAANKAAARTPNVELNIPKCFDAHPVPARQYKTAKRSWVAEEVAEVLGSDNMVQYPEYSEKKFEEYTIRKMAWWFLKNEKTPAEQGLYHPECHDNEDQESDHDDDFDWPSDISSINGCVGDPGGRDSEIPPDPTQLKDANWADDYCGAAYSHAKIRNLKEVGGDERPKTITLKQAKSLDGFKTFIRVKPRTKYAKPIFKVKCLICGCTIVGKRKYGAHIRSDSHKQCFRNYSLRLASYNEMKFLPAPKKEFVAKLAEESSI